MTGGRDNRDGRAERRAAPGRLAVPSGDRLTYPSGEGLTGRVNRDGRAERRVAPSRPAVPSADRLTYPSGEGLT